MEHCRPSSFASTSATSRSNSAPSINGNSSAAGCAFTSKSHDNARLLGTADRRSSTADNVGATPDAGRINRHTFGMAEMVCGLACGKEISRSRLRDISFLCSASDRRKCRTPSGCDGYDVVQLSASLPVVAFDIRGSDQASRTPKIPWKFSAARLRLIPLHNPHTIRSSEW